MSAKQIQQALENIKPSSIDNLLLNIKGAELAKAIVQNPTGVQKAIKNLNK